MTLSPTSSRGSGGLTKLATSGPPSTGTAAVADAVADIDGLIWVCTVAGTPGTWIATTIAGTVSQGPAYNLLPQNMRYFRRALGRVLSGTANGSIFCQGDSTTAGSHATSFAKAYPTVLAGLINSYLAPCVQGWAFSASGQGGAVVDSGMTIGANWAPFGIGWNNTSGISGTISYAPHTAGRNGPATTDTVDIYWIRNAGFGSFTVDIGGGTLATVATGGALATQKTTVNYAAGANTINITGPTVGTSVYILGMNAYLSTSKVLSVANIGVAGTFASTWAPTAPVYDKSNYATIYSPDLAIVDLGINDANTPVAPATYKTQMQSIVTGITGASSDCLLKSMVPSGDARATVELTYLPQLQALAYANNIPFLDGFNRWTSYAVSNPLGYYFDALHPADLGYAEVANAVLSVLRTL